MKKIVLSTILTSTLFTGTLLAESNKTQTSKEIMHKATKVATIKANESKVKLTKEAISSLELTTDALKNLNDNKLDEAKKNIELALGKLEAILALKDTPKLLPIQNKIVVKNFVGTSKDVEIALKEVKELLKEGKVQEAGELLITIQSEIDITVINLPLVSYPDALKLASKYIIEEKPDRAKEVLELALSTFTEVHQIIPIPLVNTIELAAAASKISQKDKEQALKYLTSAHDELNKAEKMGYVSKSTTTYKELHDLIEEIEKEIKGKNKAEKLFDNLAKKLNEFKDNILSSSDKEK